MASPSSARVSVVDDAGPHELFEVAELTDGLLRARLGYRFELGEELKVRIEDAGAEAVDAIAVVRGYTPDGLVELVISDRAPTRSVVSG